MADKEHAEEASAGLMTARELASYLRVHTSTIYLMLRQRKLPGFKVGSSWRFKRLAVEEWLARLQRKE